MVIFHKKSDDYHHHMNLDWNGYLNDDFYSHYEQIKDNIFDLNFDLDICDKEWDFLYV